MTTEIKETYRKIGIASFTIIIVTFADKILAVAKEMLLAKNFGISAEMDVFNIAYAFPGIIVLFFSAALLFAFIPLYVEWLNRKSLKDADNHALMLFYFFFLFFFFISISGYLLSPYIFHLIGYGFNENNKELGIFFEKWIVFLIFFDGSGIILKGLLQAKKKFFSLSAAPLFINIVIIIFVVLGYSLGIYSLIWGFLIGTFLKTLYMAIILSYSGFSFFSKFSFDKSILSSFIFLALPMIGSELICNANILIDQIMASELSSGSVSALRYAYRINDLPIQIIIIAISQAIFPFIAEQVFTNNYDGLRAVFKRAVIFLCFLTLPIICLITLFSEDIVVLLLQRGAFDIKAARETAGVLVFYSYGLFFYAYSFVNGTFFGALKDTKPLFYVGCISVFLNLVLNIIFMKIMGARGIALSTTVTLGIVSAIFVMLLKKRIKITGFTHIIFDFLKILISAFCMFAIGYILIIYMKSLGIHRLYYLLTISCFICSLYLLIIRSFKSHELNECISIFGLFFKKI